MAARYHLGENVFCRFEFDGHRAGALDLLFGLLERAVVGYGGGLDDDAGLVDAAEDGIAHFGGRDDGNNFAVCRRAQCGRRGHQNDARSTALGRFGEGVAHLSAGTVAEKAHGVESFARASGGDEDGFSARGRCDDAASQGQLRRSRRFRRGGPLPVMPQARYPLPGGTMRTLRLASVSRLACVAGCCHMFTFMAGATMTGAVVAR